MWGALSMDPILLVGVALGLGSIVALAWGIRTLVVGKDPAVERLRLGKGAAAELKPVVLGKSVPRSIASIAKIAQSGGEGAIQVRGDLVHAGFRGEYAVQVFLASKVVGALVLPLALLLSGAERLAEVQMAAPLAVIACGVGFFAPNVWLRGRIKGRQRQLERGLPDTLDLLVTCVEAGLALDAALARVATETGRSSAVLGDELGLTFLEIQAGIPRVEAFRRLAERTGVEDLRSLAATLAQSDMFGTSVAVALRVRADWMRTRRMQNAEERAAVVSVKMTIPLVFCILPSLMVVVMGPAIVSVARNLMPTLSQGGP